MIINLLLIEIIIIKLRMIMRLHEGSARKIIHHGRNPGYRDGKIVRPGLNRICHSDTVRVRALRPGHRPDEFLQKRNIFVDAAYLILSPVRMGRQFKVHVRDHPPPPFRVNRKDLLKCPRGPVIFGIHNAPFLRRHSAEQQRLLRPVPAFKQGLRNTEHHGDRRVVILKAVEVRIIMRA